MAVNDSGWGLLEQKLSTTLWLMAVASALVALSCGQPQVSALPSLSEAAPEMTSLVFSNQLVNATMVELSAGATVPEHFSGPRLIRAGTDFELQITAGDQSTALKMRAEEARELPAGKVSISNSSASEARFLNVARNDLDHLREETNDQKQGGPVPDIEEFPDAKLVSQHFLVYELRLEAEEKLKLDDRLPRLLYAQTPCELKLRFPDGELVTMTLRAGEIEWLEAEIHVMVNAGDSTAVLLSIGIRS